jgi:lysophospholipase L1-like esterase
MTGSPWTWVLWLGLVGIPWLGSRRFGQLTVPVAVIHILSGATFLLLFPSAGKFETIIAVVGLLTIDVAALLAPASLVRRLQILARRRRVKILLSVLLASLVPLGSTELVCRILTEARILRYHVPLQTVWRAGCDDWRAATITGDKNREPDPVLFWRPVAHGPFNAQRFKGPIAQIPKPADVIRVMCYGDSLTDGPPKGGWPTWLRIVLNRQPPVPGRRFEVLNAGVVGYSSHQGLLRFLQEVDTYQPDLLLVSFGWNDPAEAAGQPDKSFQPPPWPVVLCQRALIRYRAYLVLMYYTRGLRPPPATAVDGASHPRVSLEDYLANLDRFREEAQARGISIVFLTRAHKLAPAVLRQNPTWRGIVPDYNAALVDWARRRDVSLIDVQGHFAQLSNTLFSDECHFTPEGYRRMAELVLDRLQAGPNRTLHVSSDPLFW